MSTNKDAIAFEKLSYLSKEMKREIEHLKNVLATKEASSAQKIKQLEDRVNMLQLNSRKVKDISEIPGRKTPKWYVVDIDFDYNDTAPKFNSEQITAEGPFICTQMQPYYLVLDDDYTHYQGSNTLDANPPAAATPLAYGRYIPCSAAAIIGSNIMNLGQYAAVGDPASGGIKGPLRDFPEFSFKLEIAGSGIFWTQDKTVPAAAFYGEREPLYLGIEGYAERTDRLIVHAQPETAVPLKGRVRMVFHGFQIAGDINISSILGY